MDYENLEPGDKLQKDDEYSTTSGVWRLVPKFMFGDVIPDSNTSWKRPVSGDSKSKEKLLNK